MAKIITLLFLLSLTVRADEWDRIWADSSMDRDLVARYMNQTYPCDKSAENFLGCLQLVNGIGDGLKEAVQFVPESFKIIYPEAKFRELASYGPVKLVEIIRWGEDAPDTRSTIELDLAFNRALQKAALDAFPQKIDFAALVDDLAGRASQTKNLKRVYAGGINRMLDVHDGHGRIDTLDHIQDMGRGKPANISYGIGVIVETVEDNYMVMSVLPKSPAAEAGVKVGDRVTHIDGKPLAGTSKAALVSLLRGPLDSAVSFTIRRGGQTLPDPITMKRASSPIQNVNPSIVNDLGQEYALIRIRGFTSNLGEELGEAIRALPKTAKGIILDLRGNAGGESDEALSAGGLFIGNKVMYLKRLITNGVTQEKASVYAAKGKAITDLPLAVLIDAGSASASEMFAGAMQDHRRAWIVGVRSYGKATVQSLKDIPDYGDIKEFTTVARFYQPLDHTNQIVGVQADFEVYRRVTPTEDEKFAQREENEVPAALPPAGAKWTQPRVARIAELDAACLNRRRAEATYLERARQERVADLQAFKAQEVLACDAATPTAIQSEDVGTEEAKDENLEAFRAHLKEVNARLPQPGPELVAWLREQGLAIPADFKPPAVELVVPDDLDCDGGEDECRLNVRDGRYLVTAAIEGAALSGNVRYLSELLLYVIRDVQLAQENGQRRKCAYWQGKNVEAIVMQGRYLVTHGSRPAGLQPVKMPDCEP